MFSKHHQLLSKVSIVFLALLIFTNIVYFEASYTSQTIWIMLIIYAIQTMLLRGDKCTLRSFSIVMSLVCAASIGLGLYWYSIGDMSGAKSAAGSLVSMGALTLLEIIAFKKRHETAEEIL
ncbi:hypothetical protein [Porphyromonas sp.]|uniref:hypothetical protein n=1 Tax=Porphyromonas sp. TaxID=1924944 RepID=UPI0026DD150B|nr:hypothetical protein [Porphyromonas sp.]MDO4770869.1 hypothetical protein [Porphyromonas sp.]